MNAPLHLITGAGGGTGGVSRQVIEQLRERGQRMGVLVHHDDARADPLRDLGAEVVVGDLTATAVVCDAALECGRIESVANISQMPFAHLTLTTEGESRQQRLHYLAEHVLSWSGIAVVYIRPTTFLDNPMFTSCAAVSLRERNLLVLPFGAGRTSPIATSDVSRTVATVLMDPARRIGDVYELTGPVSLDFGGLAAEYTFGLRRPMRGTDILHETWVREVLEPRDLPVHVKQHLATMALLHRAGRYDRATDDVEKITGQRPAMVGRYITEHPEFFC